jgi:hypothetical protein
MTLYPAEIFSRIKKFAKDVGRKAIGPETIVNLERTAGGLH